MHYHLVLPLYSLLFLLPLHILEPVEFGPRGTEGLPRGEIALGIGETLHVQLVLSEVPVIVKGIVAHLLLDY